ncbi:hypothetical protein [Nocardioides yefusunii]|uniref:Uncharacterized protein n=1 Tax=Nocardioides yefusunii TaxID=2500546 RepID=A0ABW1QTB6_9ACTN|nr:hypothetical protein [Nocardioides yefusunii]
MPASRSARQRKAGVEAGPLAVARIDLADDDSFVYKFTCTECEVPRPGTGTRAWGTYRRGEDNGYMASMDRWILHLESKHADLTADDAPCLRYLAEAHERLDAQRSARTEQQDS